MSDKESVHFIMDQQILTVNGQIMKVEEEESLSHLEAMMRNRTDRLATPYAG